MTLLTFAAATWCLSSSAGRGLEPAVGGRGGREEGGKEKQVMEEVEEEEEWKVGGCEGERGGADDRV